MRWRAGAKPSPLQTSNGLRVYRTHVDVKIPVQVDSRTLPSCPGLLCRGIQELTFQGFQLLLTQLVGRDSLKVSVNMDENGCLIDTGIQLHSKDDLTAGRVLPTHKTNFVLLHTLY